MYKSLARRSLSCTGGLPKWCLRKALPQASVYRPRSNYPERIPSINETAKRLGFDKGSDMFPEYPLESPPKLWMVKQTHKLKYRPFWEKECMKDMGLYRKDDISIQMNTPTTNEKLWQVKHLIRIKPIRFPDGPPTKEDIGGTQLTDSGELIVFRQRCKDDETPAEELVPMPAQNEWKIVDGYRMCYNCKQRRCLKYQMCQKIWHQRGRNNIEKLGPRMFRYVDNPDKENASNGKT